MDASVCNNKQRWREDKCKCDCKELIAKGTCDKGFIWNSSNCECQFDKSCDVGEYLDYKNYQCRKRLVDKLVEECHGNIDGKELYQNEMIYNSTTDDYEKICTSCERSFYTMYMVFFVVFHNKYIAVLLFTLIGT